MKIKTSELTGAALDWAVAQCDGINISGTEMLALLALPESDDFWKYRYSTNWSQGGPIIEREEISVDFGRADFKSAWIAYKLGEPYEETPEGGPTPLIAAMRCYVASKLGDEVDVPGLISTSFEITNKR